MKYLRLFGIAAVATCAASALLASTALALPSLLIGSGGESASTWTGKNVGELEAVKQNGKSYKCSGGTGEGTVEAKKPLGEFHVHATGCTGSGFTCTGEGENSGVILSLGSWHLVYDTLKAGLTGSGVAVLSLLAAGKATCGGIVKIEVKAGGMALCLVLNPEALTKRFEGHCKSRGTPFGPEETKYDNAAGTWVSITPVLSNENGGAFEETVGIGSATVELTEDTLIMI